MPSAPRATSWPSRNSEDASLPKTVKDIPALLKAIREAHAVDPEDARDRLQQIERRLAT